MGCVGVCHTPHPCNLAMGRLHGWVHVWCVNVCLHEECKNRNHECKEGGTFHEGCS